ncbi:MAG: hypothetical protein KDA89_07790 [Planctomycetaceae bacterium]|nr:hypothetical protein [Planctomycetaceae bacterium]
MPVTRLFVEGHLDAEILTKILNGDPVVERRGPKSALDAQTKSYREYDRLNVGYLRDRDFDFEPPEEHDVPVRDSKEGDFGWRWSRHEMENYLLEPSVLLSVFPHTAIDYWAEHLTQVAERILFYQAARWTIGQTRIAYPAWYHLETRPQLNELRLPADLSEFACRLWCEASVNTFAERVARSMNPEDSGRKFDHYFNRLSGLSDDAAEVLRWFSGKDLLAGFPDSVLGICRVENAGSLRATVRDWICSNPEAAIGCLPEFRVLSERLRSAVQ